MVFIMNKRPVDARYAYTYETDDAALAVEDILRQLELESCKKRSMVGILTCHYEFVHSGVVRAVCEALPFDVVGITTTAQAVGDECDILLLTLTVLEGDDVEFAVACSEPLSGDIDSIIGDTYNRAAASYGARPALMLTYAPLLLQYAGDQYVDILDRASGGVPNFGSLSMDDTTVFDKCYTIYNGECRHDTLAVILIYADIQPKFHVGLVSGEHMLSNPAVITRSEGNLLKEVDGMPFIKYAESLGLVENGALKPNIHLLVFVLNNNDGTPEVGKVLININERGECVCGGYMPEGSTMRLSLLHTDEVVSTAAETASAAVNDGGNSVALVFSCNTRNIVLGADFRLEYDAVRKAAGDRLSFCASLSGGEICPYIMPGGAVKNRFHNNSFIMCTF